MADKKLSDWLVRVYTATSLEDLESVQHEAKNTFAEQHEDLLVTLLANIERRRDDLEEKADLNNTVAEKDSTIAEKDSTIADQNNIIADRNNTIADQNNTIAKQKGEYFNTIDEVWEREEHLVSDADGQAAIALLKRAGDQIPEEYQEIVNMYNNAEEVNNIELAMTRDNSYTSRKRVRLFPCDFFGNEGTGEMFHLIPNAPGCAIAHDDVAAWALGLSDTMDIPQRSSSCFQSISCFQNPKKNNPAVKRRKLAMVGSKENKEANEKRGSSLKHHHFNHIRLKSHSKHIDQNPAAMFVPCVQRDFIKNWDGRTGYTVLCIVGDWEGGREGIEAHKAATEIGMTLSSEECTTSELIDATDRLRDCLKALAYSLRHRESFEGISDHVEDLQSTKKI